MVDFKEIKDPVGIRITNMQLHGKNFLLWEKSVSRSWCKRQNENSYFCETCLYWKGVWRM